MYVLLSGLSDSGLTLLVMVVIFVAVLLRVLLNKK